jgi:hypothetical protein
MKKLLMIASHLPPIRSVGSQRVLKFAKYLPLYGWQPIVLTKSSKYIWEKDWSLMSEIPNNIIVERAFYPDWLQLIAEAVKNLFCFFCFPSVVYSKENLSINAKPEIKYNCKFYKKSIDVKLFLVNLINSFKRFCHQYLLIPDDDMVWLPFLILKAIKISKREKIDAVYVTVPSYTCFIAGAILKILLKKPCVVDYRDLWIGDFGYIWKTKYRVKLEYFFEKACFHFCNAIITVSEPMIIVLKTIYPHLSSKLIRCIYNGYDSEDFANLKIDHLVRNSRFTITYTGTFFKNRSADSFITGLGELLNLRYDLHGKIRVKFIGGFPNEHLKRIQKIINMYALHDTIEFYDAISYTECLRQQIESDVLLLIIGVGQNNNCILTTKLFEYLASRRPILAIVPKGAARDMIVKTQSGIAIDPDDIEGIKKSILELYDRHRQNELLLNPRNKLITTYDRKILTQQLSDILNTITSQ